VTIVPVGAGTCRSMCGEVQVHSSVMESKGLLSLDMGVLHGEVMIFSLGGLRSASEIVGMGIVLRL
jgi:hypothetical protein